MDFTDNKPIYLQIHDAICESIASGELSPESRIPSVREYGAEIGVNPNTVMRTYERLTNEGVIYNKRGIGYFVTPDAKVIVLKNARDKFLRDELPAIRRKMSLLGIDPSVLSVDTSGSKQV